MLTALKMTAKEIHVSERFLRQLVKECKVPFYRLGPRTIRFDIGELKDYMRLVAESRPK
jgi:hypothetical protein